MQQLNTFVLAIDLGTTRTTAATARLLADGSTVVTMHALGRASDSTPSAVFVADDDLLFGDAAERRGLAQPDRLIREFKRRIGDDMPIHAGEQRVTAEQLYARLCAWVIDDVTEREGAPPAAVAVTIPATWGPHRAGTIAAAVAQASGIEVDVISEPEAAAGHYASTTDSDAWRTLAVYDLGGGTFDTVILRRDADGSVRPAAAPLGLDDFGGAHFDDQVLRHAVTAAGLDTARSSSDPSARAGLATLRRECVEAKEALSFDAEAVIPVLVGNSPTAVRLTRIEFEDMIQEGLERTIDTLDHALEAADVPGDELDAILLTGGSSRIPRVAELLSERFDRPIAVDADPKAVVAMGAARALAGSRLGAALPIAIHPAAAALAETPDAAVAAPVPEPATERARRSWFRRTTSYAAMGAAAIVLSGGIVLASATGLGRSSTPESLEPTPSLAVWLGLDLLEPSSAAAGEPETTVATPSPTPTPLPAPPAATRPADSAAPGGTPRVSNPRADRVRSASTAPRASSPTPTRSTPSTNQATPPTTQSSAPSPGSTTAPAPTQTSAPSPAPTQTTAPTTPPPAPDPTPTTPPPPAPEPDPTPTTPPPPAPEPDPTPTTPPPPAPEPDPTPDPPVDPSPAPTDPT